MKLHKGPDTLLNFLEVLCLLELIDIKTYLACCMMVREFLYKKDHR